MPPERLDRALVARGLAPSRARAQSLIAAGAVTIDGAPATRSSAPVAADAALAVTPDHPWVSRAALKLVAALDAFSLSPEGRIALDLGASTGGFTQVLLARGAAAVWAVDVGHGQLAPALRADPRVHLREGLNARDLAAAGIPAPAFLTADLSFIPLATALPPALALAAPGAALVALVKPQFEVGPAQVGRGGIVRDEAAQARAVAGVLAFLEASGWTPIGTIESPITGTGGNREWLVAARKPV